MNPPLLTPLLLPILLPTDALLPPEDAGVDEPESDDGVETGVEIGVLEEAGGRPLESVFASLLELAGVLAAEVGGGVVEEETGGGVVDEDAGAEVGEVGASVAEVAGEDVGVETSLDAGVDAGESESVGEEEGSALLLGAVPGAGVDVVDGVGGDGDEEVGFVLGEESDAEAGSAAEDDGAEGFEDVLAAESLAPAPAEGVFDDMASEERERKEEKGEKAKIGAQEENWSTAR